MAATTLCTLLLQDDPDNALPNDLKLGLGCNLGKDLSKSKGDDQLVKCKDIELYLLLYIPNDYEESI